MNGKVTQEILNTIGWNNFSLMPMDINNPGGPLVLILICSDQPSAQRFIEVLHTNPFNVRYIEQDVTGKHIFDLIFTATNLGIKFISPRTEQTYPVRARLNQGINYITTGYKVGEQIMSDMGGLLPLDLTRNLN